ncbi:hypothetical protein [Enterobacter hormaechei]|uniref:hypothetical protein n=1 Tax=Enterobacter hormaechei TaxID=158836 RepID=UPI003CC90EA9
MKSRAAVAFAPGKPLEIVEIDVAPPKKGEVLIKNTHTGVCHTDAFTLSGMTLRAFSRWFSATREPVSSLKLVKASPV